MSLNSFTSDPWGMSHRAYADSVINIRPAPEFATAEVMIASLYRASGFATHSERDVLAAGREFDEASKKIRVHERSRSQLSLETWRAVLHEILESPKQPNQSSKRFLQLCPVVPDVALYSGTARLQGNSWNPGALLQRIILIGSDTSDDAKELWRSLFLGLSVDDSDDIWARWLQEEFGLRRRSAGHWAPSELKLCTDFPQQEKSLIQIPARQFVRDLRAILDAKSCMTRRQWISILEACVRLGAVAHVLWLCNVNAKLWEATKLALGEGVSKSTAGILEEVISCDGQFLAYGSPAVPIVRDYASRYLSARLGLNCLLWSLEEIKLAPDSLNSAADLAAFLNLIAKNRNRLNASELLASIRQITEDQARTINCRKGIGSNLVEFARHVLGQRQTANESLRGYDQGYFLRKRGEHNSAPWVVSLGPVAVLALVHCCLRDAAGPRSVQRLCRHLALYGIEVDVDDIVSSDLGRNLRMLGLILDSPDAESGMLLIHPFDLANRETKGGTP